MESDDVASEPDGSKENEESSSPVPGPSTSSDDSAKRKMESSSDKSDDRERKNVKRSSSFEKEEETEEEAVAGASNEQSSVNSSSSLSQDNVELLKVIKNFGRHCWNWPSSSRSSSDSDSDDSEDEDDDLPLNDEGQDPNSGIAEALNMVSSPSSTGSSDSRCRQMIDNALEDASFTPPGLLKTKPKHNWIAAKEIIKRQLGFPNIKQGSKLFEERMHGSLHAVQRLKLMAKLENHTGCVNSLNFNSSGTLLASCSDDLTVCLWNWSIDKLLCSVESGHKSNIFQAKFLPLQGHIFIATCARDGQVRLLELNTDGSLFNRRQAGAHHRPSHKLALIPNSPHSFLSCGEDSVVLHVDIRQNRPNKVLSVMAEGKKVALYSISSHPLDSNEFMLGGRDRYLRIYDRRNVTAPVTMYCPSHIKQVASRYCAYVTCAVYNYCGSEVLASYNDEDIYLWDRRDPAGEWAHQYEGHRNNVTIKGVNFFGPRSQYIVSGSDCGNIFFWDKETEAIVQWLPGDENGVVNCLEPHPHIPVLATSGLDDDVKIWVPTMEQEPSFDGLKATVIINQKRRFEYNQNCRNAEDTDGQMMWLLWRHVNRVNRLLGANNEAENQDHDSNTGLSDAIFRVFSSSPNDSYEDEDDEEEEMSGINYSDFSSPS